MLRRVARSRRTVDGPATYSYKFPAGDVSHMRIERFATRGGREGAQGGYARCMSALRSAEGNSVFAFAGVAR